MTEQGFAFSDKIGYAGHNNTIEMKIDEDAFLVGPKLSMMSAIAASAATAVRLSEQAIRGSRNGTSSENTSGQGAVRGRREALSLASITFCMGNRSSVVWAQGENAHSSLPSSGGETALRSGHVQACRGGNPNCISTFSKGEENRASPWRYDGSLSDAADALVQLVPSEWEGAELVESKRLPDGSYLAFQGPGPFGTDDLEIILRSGSTGIDSTFTDGGTGVLSFRCEARDIIFLYPIQTPLSALGAERNRMERIRLALGWDRIE